MHFPSRCLVVPCRDVWRVVGRWESRGRFASPVRRCLQVGLYDDGAGAAAPSSEHWRCAYEGVGVAQGKGHNHAVSGSR